MVCKYSVKWDFDGEILLEEGIAFGSNYCDIMANVMGLFSDDEVISIALTWISDDSNLVSFEDLLTSFEIIEKQESTLGQQIIEALTDAVNAAKED